MLVLVFFSLNTAPQVGAHGDRIYALPGDLDDTISRRLVDSPSRPPSFNPTSSSANIYARPCQLYSEQREIRTGSDSGYPVPQNSFMSGPMGSFTSRVQSLGDSCTHMPSILPQRTNLLGLRSYPSRSFVPETSSISFSLIRSDKPVYATASIRPSGPCQPTSAMAGLMFVLPQESRSACFIRTSHGGFPYFGYLDPYRLQAPHHLFGAEGGYACPTALGSSAPRPPGYDRFGQFDSSFLYQQTRRDTFPHLVTSNSRTSPLVRGSEHDSLSKTYPRLSERDSSQYRQRSGPFALR